MESGLTNSLARYLLSRCLVKTVSHFTVYLSRLHPSHESVTYGCPDGADEGGQCGFQPKTAWNETAASMTAASVAPSI